MNINVMVGWAARAVALALSFVNTRLLIDCIGKEGLASYSIIFSLALWLALLNFGLPIVVQNSISRLRGMRLEHETMLDHAYGSTLVITVCMIPAVILVGIFVKLFLLASYPFVSMMATIGLCIFIFLAGQGQILIQIMYAEHRAFWPNVYPALVAGCISVTLLIVGYLQIGDINVVLLMVGLAYLLVPLHATFVLKVFKRAKINISSTLKKIKEARSQWLFAILSCCTLALDYIIMSRILQPSEIVEYNLANRLFGVILVMHSVLLATSWTSVGDLMHRDEKDQVKKRVKFILVQGLMIGVVLGFVILISMDWLVVLWTKDQVSHISIGLGVALWVYVIMRIWSDTFAMVLLAFDKANVLNRFIPLQAIISATAGVVLGSYFGATGVVAGLTLSFVLTSAWILPYKYRRLIEQ